MAEPVRNEEDKLAFVLTQMQAGRDRNDVAADLGYKNWRGLDVYMRRKGYLYQDEHYVLADDETGIDVVHLVTQPVRIVLEQLKNGNMDMEDIAVKAGFRHRSELTRYMKTHGWQWDAKKETYVQPEGERVSVTETEDCCAEGVDDSSVSSESNGASMDSLQDYLPLLQYLMEHRSDLEQLLGQTSKSGAIPRYALPHGVVVTKSVSMASTLDQLSRDFAKERGVSQRNVFEAALIQFLIKYGYSQQVERLLARD